MSGCCSATYLPRDLRQDTNEACAVGHTVELEWRLEALKAAQRRRDQFDIDAAESRAKAAEFLKSLKDDLLVWLERETQCALDALDALIRSSCKRLELEKVELEVAANQAAAVVRERDALGVATEVPPPPSLHSDNDAPAPVPTLVHIALKDIRTLVSSCWRVAVHNQGEEKEQDAGFGFLNCKSQEMKTCFIEVAHARDTTAVATLFAEMTQKLEQMTAAAKADQKDALRRLKECVTDRRWRYVSTYEVPKTSQNFAVSQDGRLLAVSTHSRAVILYDLPDGAQVRVLRETQTRAASPSVFRQPSGLCFSYGGNLLVAGNRVRELTVMGEHVGFFESVDVPPTGEVCEVACTADIIVTAHYRTREVNSELVCVFDARTRALVRRFGMHSITSMCFTPDGKTLVVADMNSRRISAFELDGTLLGSICDPGVLETPIGVAALSDGRIVAVDYHNDRIAVFPPLHGPIGDGSAVLSGVTFMGSSTGKGGGQFFTFPTVTCVAQGLLYVMDNYDDRRVQCFAPVHCP